MIDEPRRRPVLRRRRRGAGVLRRRRRARCACWRCRPTTSRASTTRQLRAAGGHTMSAAHARLDELLDGIAPLPRDVRGRRDLTLDSRAVAAGRRLPRAAGRPRSTASSTQREAVARGARAVLWDPRRRPRARQPAPGVPFVAVPRAARPRSAASPIASSARPRAAHGGRRHRHQRQDDLRLATRAGARALGAPRRLPRHARPGCPPDVAGGALTTPDAITRAPQLRALARCRRDARRDGSVVARARPGARRRRAIRHRRVHQPDARSPRLPRHHGALRATRRRDCSSCPGSSTRSSTSTIRSARASPRVLSSGVELTAVAVGRRCARRGALHARRPRQALRTAASSSRSAGISATRRAALAADRRLQRREPAHRARRAARLGSSALERSARCARRRARAPPGRMEGFRRPNGAARGRRLRAHARCARARRSRPRARTARGRLARRVRLRRRSRPRQAAADGRDRRASSPTTSSSPTTTRAREDRRPRSSRMIAAGHPRPERVLVERDRARAIARRDRRRRSAGDVVLIAGKGHEDYQIYGARAPPVQRPRGRARRAAERAA